MQTKNPENKFEGCVLAGGRSSRMGTDKAFLKIEGETFAQRAARILESVCSDRVKIVLNPRQSAGEFSPLTCIRDIFPDRGAVGAIHAALAESRREWIFVLACDLPLVTSATITELAKIAAAQPAEIAAVVPRQPDGRFQPLCALYRASSCLSPLTELLQNSDSVSVRRFLESIPVRYVDPDQLPGFDETVFFNVNLPADYQTLIEE